MPAAPRSALPSLPAIAFILWSAITAFVLGHQALNGDGDVIRHVRHGEAILAAGDVLRADAFSFTRPGAPFVGFEYGSQVAIALVHRAAGLAGVTLFGAALFGAAIAGVAAFLLRRGTDPLLAFATSTAAGFLGLQHWIARPHLVGWLLTLVLLALLERERPPRLPWIAALFAAWVNLHGSWVYGAIVLGIYATGAAVDWWRDRTDAARVRARALALALPVALAATLANPYGPALYPYLAAHLGDGYMQDFTSEFMSPDFHTLGPRVFAVLLLAALGALVLARPAVPAARLLLVLASAGFALQAVRNVALFGLVALPLVALAIDAWWRGLAPLARAREAFAAGAGAVTTLPWVAAWGAGLAALALAGGRVGGTVLVADAVDPRTFPVALVARARSEGLTGRYFHEFTWGGYLEYAWPEQPVFIDGGTDFFGPAILRAYAETAALQPSWRAHLERWRIDRALLPVRGALAMQLAHEPGWRLHACDGTAALFVREPAFAGADGAARLTTCAEIR